MTMLDLEMNALDIARSAAGLGVNWLIQSSLLIVAGLWIGSALRYKGSAAQSAVFRTTLAAVLVCPLVSWGLALFGATGWSLEMPAAYTHEEVFAPLPQDADTGPAVELEPVVATDTEIPSFEALENTARLESSTPNEFPVSAPAVDLVPPAVTEEEVAAAASAVPAPTPTVSTNWFGILAIVVGTTWLLLGGWLLARLAHSWRQLIRLRRTATAADAATTDTCRNVAELFRVDPPTVLLSPFLPSPCLAGLHRPAVLLPDDELSLPMRDVLIHELAHLARGDCYWNLLRRIGTSLLFFQPLMWHLSRRLDLTAEEVCDDYVVQFGGDRREYAHRLVDIAELSVAPLAAAGVGIVSLRSMLAARVARIMDTSRSLSTRVGHALLALVLLAGTVGTVLVGLVGVEPYRAAAEANTDAEAQSDESEQPLEIDLAADRPSDDEATPTGAITGTIQSVESDSSLEPANEDDPVPLTKVHGRVVDETGQPVPGALIRVMRNSLSLKNKHELLDQQRASDNGSFEVIMTGVDGVPRWMYRRDPQTTTYLTSIIATAPGYAAAWAGRTQQLQNPNDEGKTGELVLRLSKQPSTIRGTIVNLEGQPVAGASVQVTAIATSEPGAVDQWLATVERLRVAGKLPKPSSMADYAVFASAMVMDRNNTVFSNQTDDPYFPQKYQVGMGHPEFPAAVTTDADGRFEIAGLAPDQLVGLSISGPGIVAHSIIAVTREIDALDLPHTSVANNIANGYYGATFAHPAAPGVAIAVKLKDAEADEPLPGMGVSLVPVLNNVWTHNPAWHGITDDNGKIRIEGLPTDTKILLSVDPPQGAPYLAVEHLEVPEGNPLETTEVEIKFRRGVFVRGKVTDAETGEPVDATLHYHPYIANENAKNYQRYQTNSLTIDIGSRRYHTTQDGTFEAVVIPGRGILAVHARDRDEFCMALGAEAIDGLDEHRQFPTHGICPADVYHRLLEIDVPADIEEVRYDLTVSRGATVSYRVTDAEGQPIAGVIASGAAPFRNYREPEADNATFKIKALRPNERRRVAFIQPDRQLGRIIEVAAPQNALSNAEPMSVSLAHCGTVVGKLINAEGEPVVKVPISAYALPMRNDSTIMPQNAFTDNNGRFRLDCLPIGAAYRIAASSRESRDAQLANEFTFEPGEKIDLGTIDVTKKERPEPRRVKSDVARLSSTQDVSESQNSELTTIRGRVLGADGEPFAGATVFADWVFVGGRWPRPRSEPSQSFEHSIAAQTTSDTEGHFELTFSKNSPREGRLSHSWHIAAYAEGFGPAWKRDVHLLKDSSPTLQLTRDLPVRGRILDLEGKPIAGVNVQIRELRQSNGEEAVAKWIKESQEKSPPKAMDAYFFGSSEQYAGAFPTTWDDGGLAGGSQALPVYTKTDGDGRFSFKNLGENRLAMLEVDGPSIAKSYLAVVTRDMESVSARPLNMIGIRADTYFGREFEYVAEPTQPITGTVTDADTGQPLEDVEVRLGQFAGNLFSQGDFLATRTNAEGKYELIGAPQGGGHRIDFEPAVDQPYFPTPKTLPLAPGSFDPIVCDMALKRGQWIVGKVSDAASHEPVVDATVHYLPLRSNEQVPKYANYDPRITGSAPRDRYRTSKDGTFRVLAIPGAGILAAIAQGNDSHTFSSLSVDEVPKHLVGNNGNVNAYHPWTITGYHALREVEILESVDEIPYGLAFRRGLTRRLKLVDANGASVAGVRVLGRIFPPRLEQPLEDSAVDIISLRANDQRVVALVHPERRIGKTLVASPGDETTVELEPCALARGRVVDEDGQPIRDVNVGVSIDQPDNWGRELIGAATDADGRFEVLLPPGLTYRVGHYSQGGIEFSAHCKATSAVVIELGNLVNGTKLTVEQTANLTKGNESNTQSSTTTIVTPLAEKTTASKVRGRVLDDGGQPVAGAKVQLSDDEATEAQTTTSGVDGGFEIEFDKAQFTKPDWHQEAWRFARLLVTADDFAPNWLEGKDLTAGKELVVNLKRDDVPIRGQILTLEGQPVPDAQLLIWDIHQPNGGNLDGLFASLRESPVSMQLQAYRNREMSWFRGRSLELNVTRGTLDRTADAAIVTADAEGRFEFTGLGPERLARGRIEGRNIQSVEISIATRSKVDDWWKREPLSKETRMYLESGDRLPQIYPSTFEHFANPSSPIVGVVLERETGKPIPGIGVSGGIRGGGDHANAVTDENGRYELTGLATDGTLRLFAGPADGAQLPYIGVEREVQLTSGVPPKQEDTQFKLTRGIVIRGTVTDATTAQPVKARVEYMAHESNPRVAAIGDEMYPYEGNITNDQGEFAVVVLPGPGALAATTRLASDVPDRYRPTEAEDFGLPLTEDGWISTANHGLIRPVHYKVAKFLNLTPDEKSPVVSLTVQSISDLARVRCVNEKGRQLKEVSVIGHLPWSGKQPILPAGGLELGGDPIQYFEIAGLNEEARQPAIFMHRKSNTAAILFPSNSARQPRLADLKKLENQMFELKLLPAATISGRVVDDEGKPLRMAQVELHLATDSAPTIPTIEIIRRYTDSSGRFELPNVPAGSPYLIAMGGEGFPGGIAKRDIELTAGQTLDLGDVDITKGQQAEPNRAPVPVQTNANEKSNTSAKIANESLRYAGQVVDAKGQPIEGAKIHLAYWYSNQDSPPDGRPLATTTADGKFQFSMSRREFRQTGDSVPPWLWGSIVAVADGHGAAWAQSLSFETTGSALAEAIERAQQQGRSVAEVQSRHDAERGPLRLARDDLPIEGRVVDINGLPIAGAKVKVVELRTGKDNTLDAWEYASQRPGINLYEASQAAAKHLYGPFVAEILPQTLTDGDGRFRLRGLGRDRLVRLVIEADGFEINEVYSRLRAAETVALADPSAGNAQVHGPRFTHVLAPSRPVEGIVRDAKTHQPVAGARVTSRRSGVATADRQIQRAGSDFVRAVTNEAGQFRLTGLPNSPQNPLIFQPASDQPYLTTSMRADTRGADSSPVTLNVELTPAGGIVIGRVVDQDTGQGVSGQIKYLAVNKNDSRPGAASTAHVTEDIRSDMEGHFRFVAPAGPAYLAFNAFDESYRLKDSRPEGATEMAEYALFMARGNGPQFHALAKIDVDGKRKEYPVELKVERSNIITGQLLDPNGQPLSADGGSYTGRVEFARWQSLKGGKFSVLNFDAARPRQLVFVVPDRQLAGELLLKEQPQGPLTVQLQPWATVTGRIVEDDGVAIQDLTLVAGPLEATIQPRPGKEVMLPHPRLPLPPAADGWSPIKTDSDGRFVIAGLLPGIPYDLSGIRHTNPFDSLSGDITQGLKLSPGETRDLGAIELKPVSLTELLQRRQETINRSQEPEQKSRAESEPDKSETSEKSVHIRGRVVGPDGQPAAGAHIAVIGASNRERRGGDLDFRDDVLAETTTNADGNYNVALKGISSKTHTRTSIVARAEGLGLAWRRLDPDARTVEASFELEAEQPIRGRLVDIEGQPATGVRMTIAAVMPTSTDGKFTDGVGYRIFAKAPAGWPQLAPTDDDGRFVIDGIPAGHGVFIEVAGSERFAPQQISLNTGMPEQRGERDGTYRSLVKNIKAGEEAVLALAPAQIFEGVVRYEDTGEVAPHARLTIWASQQKFGSMHSVPGKADAQGRYRISPTPGIRFGVTAYPPDGAPYLTRRLPEIDWDDAAKIKQLDVTLPRGVLVRGRVVESENGVPIAGATVQYEPEETNNPNYADDILTGWQGIQISNDRGEFEIVVMPGPGHLLVHGTSGEFVIRETSSLQLMRGRPGGARYYANAIERLDPEKGADPVDVTIELERGAKIAGQLVNEAGAPVDEALMITRLNIVPTTLSWRGDASKHVLGGRFALSPLEPGVKYTVHFLDAKQRRGATVTLSTDDATPTVVLKPCGQAVARFVDEDGEPMADIRPGLHMVVTSGVNELDFEARKLGELAADTDFLANIDRVNHWDRPPTDKDGRTTYPALIPGATYRILQSVKGEPHTAREFTVESNQLLDLGEIVLERKD